MSLPDFDEQVVKIKAWYKSLTVWISSLIIAIAQIPMETIALIHPDAREWAYTVLAAALIYDRLFNTNQAVTLKAALKPVAADRVEPRN